MSDPADQENIEKKEEVVEEEEAFDMDENQFYPDNHIEKPFVDSSISRRSIKFYDCLGKTSFKRYNFHWLGDNCFIFAAGNTYQIFNEATGQRKIFHGTDTDGIGSIAVHPSKKYFAVAEKGTNPNIYIYEYPSLKLYRICRKGTEKMFAHIEFSVTGTSLASLGGDPDYTLTVWDWKKQRVVLRAKAFSQEIYRVSFSPYTDNVLFTSGSGHIRFWKMAQTFTGLKLQGEIAKFGQLELSDVSAFYELPDGKVVSGTDYGTLIVWEGQFVKAHLLLNVETKTPLHKGVIEVIIQDGDFYITAGADGFIKWWKISDIDQAEAEEGLEVALVVQKQVLIAEKENGDNPASIVNMILANKKWYIQDGKGRIYVMAYNSDIYQCVEEFHQGSINDIITSPNHNYALTIGENGMIKTWDYCRKVVVSQEIYSGKGTCLEHLSTSDTNRGRCFAAGFDNGLVRIISVTSDGLRLLKSFKAHEDAISKIRYSKDLRTLVTASVTGDIFFFDTDPQNIQKILPLCTVKLPRNDKVNDCRFTPGDQSIIFGCDTGFVYEIRRPKTEEIDNSDSYLWVEPDIKTWRIKMMEFQMQKNQKKDEAEEEKKRRMRLRGELPPEEKEPEEDWDPQPIRTIMPFVNSQGQVHFIVSSQGQFNGFLYSCRMDSPRPIQAIPLEKDVHVCLMNLYTSKAGDVVAIGYDNGNIEMIFCNNWEKRMKIKFHDHHIGEITGIAFNHDENIMLTTSRDGLLFVHQFDKLCAIEEQAFEPLEGVEGAQFLPADEKVNVSKKKLAEYFQKNPPVFPDLTEDLALDEAALAITIKTNEPTGVDINDPTIYSIQQAKLRTEEDHRLNLAEIKKEGVRKQIQQLRNEFQKIMERNLAAAEHLRIGQDDSQIDPEYFMILNERNEAKIEETKKEVGWGIEYHTVNLNKLKNKFYDVLEFEKFTVKGMKNSSYVTTFRVQKMSEFLTHNIDAFKQMLENEIIGKEDANDDDFIDDEEVPEKQVDNDNKKEKERLAAIEAKKKAAQQAALNAKKTEAEKKREARKLEREERKRKIEALEKKIAMNSSEDPEERRKIEIAQASYGDFKLKISPDYQVPENQRINFQKKKQQMVLLEGSIHKLKVDFNQKVQELKKRKKKLVQHIKEKNAKVNEINQELQINEQLFEPVIDIPSEYPENFFEIKDTDIEQFKTKLDAQKNKSKGGAKKATKGDETGRGEGEEEGAVEVEEKHEEIDVMKAKAVLRKNAKQQKTEFDEEFAQIRKIELEFDKKQFIIEIDELVSAFDSEIKEMQKEKYRLESDLKNAEMKLVLYFEELILLKSMESKDVLLTKKLAACRSQKAEILQNINTISKQIKEQKNQIQQIKDKEDDLNARFLIICPERSDKHEEIRKHYEKIIKRKRKPEVKAKVEDGDEDEEEVDEEEEDEPEEEEEEDDDENALAGLSAEEYKLEEVDKLRDERMQLVEQKESVLEQITQLDLKRKKLENQERSCKTDLEETEEEIQDFQSEKMSKLNELRISVVLKLKQIQNLVENPNMRKKWEQIQQQELAIKTQKMQEQAEENGMDENMMNEQAMMDEDWRGYYLPKDLNNSILFTRKQLAALLERKRELDQETQLEKQTYEDAKKLMKTQKREIKENEKLRETREREYNEKQMLRFGNLVDLDNLEISGPSPAVLELQMKFAKTEKNCIKAIQESEDSLALTQRELTGQMKNNTALLNLIRDLGEQELKLDKDLNDSNKAIFVDEDDEKKRHIMEEKLKIQKLLKIQKEEIKTFRSEINMYKRKGGHIYTRVTTNRRVANLNQDN